MSNSQINQHKRLAMGQSLSGGNTGQFAKGGRVGAPASRDLKTGIPDSPLTVAKMNNGIPGLKKGGKAGKGC